MNRRYLHSSLFIVSFFPVSACYYPVPKDYSPLTAYMLVLESSEATERPGENTCYADLDQRMPYNLGGAQSNETTVDLKYSYIVNGGNYTRVLYPMRKSFFPELNNVRESMFGNADSAYITGAQFEAIRTAEDLTRYFNSWDFHWSPGLPAYISNGPEDVMKQNIIAFETNDRKRGFLKISIYVPRPVAGDKARIVLDIKMEP